MSRQQSDFFRFPHTPHLAWLAEGSPRDDKVLSAAESRALLEGDVVVEEKLDGANLGFSFTSDAALRVQNRGDYLRRPYTGQFERLETWIAHHENVLFDILNPNLILFGEWCAARHSVAYDSLPDWLLVFDVYDRLAGRFWSTSRRDKLARSAGLSVVPTLARGHITLVALEDLITSASSHARSGPAEGVVVRKESREWLIKRAKLVRPDFVQNITEHWRNRGISWNRLRVPPPDITEQHPKT